MKKLITLIFSICVPFIIPSCVDDYKDANPPRLKDAPAVASVSVQDLIITDGTSTTITISVVDAPAGIDSVGYSIADENGDELGTIAITNLEAVRGKQEGEIIATYTSEPGVAAVITITFIVYDKQLSEGEVVRKESVPQGVQIEVVCPSDLAGTYSTSTSGSSTDGGANNNPLSRLVSEIVLTGTETPGEYTISDASAGAYDAWYLGVYYAEPTALSGILKDACGSITIKEFESPFDGDGVVSSGGSIDNGVITVNVVNVYGDEWTIIMTPK
ncbi:MAG TPA: hypothetical protein VI583_16845 [Cyclobacteriaceae bacterium]|nr:hypothetical protein [Cyclobacteriaceae bacterium]